MSVLVFSYFPNYFPIVGKLGKLGRRSVLQLIVVCSVSFLPSSSSVWMQSSSSDHLKNLSSCAALYTDLSQMYTFVCVDVDAASDSLSVIVLPSVVKPGIAPTSPPVPLPVPQCRDPSVPLPPVLGFAVYVYSMQVPS